MCFANSGIVDTCTKVLACILIASPVSFLAFSHCNTDLGLSSWTRSSIYDKRGFSVCV